MHKGQHTADRHTVGIPDPKRPPGVQFTFPDLPEKLRHDRKLDHAGGTHRLVRIERNGLSRAKVFVIKRRVPRDLFQGLNQVFLP